MFSTYLQLGFAHISDITAYDHILFIIALCAVYRLNEWKRILILVTAFTLGHSLTLALAALEIITFPTALIEFLIPVTILLTSLYNVISSARSKQSRSSIRLNYLFALFFGLIHGMGFSNFLRASLMPGEESRLVIQLLAFNIGIELGQLLIVGFILLVAFIAFSILRIRQREWTLFVSGATAGIALTLMMATWPG
jgi:hypothetical protein